MCIIIKNTTGKPVSEPIVERSVTINPDGFGIVYLDGKGGEFRTLDMQVAKRLLLTETRPYVAHCRFTTVGETVADNCHPFPLGKGRYLFHNGTVNVDNILESDTAQTAATLHGLSDKRIAFILTALDHCRWAVANTKKRTAETFGKWHEDSGVMYSKENVLSEPEPVYRSKYNGCSYGYYDDWNEPETYPSDEMAVDALDASKRYTVAVYGTLRYGFGNHGLIKDSDFLGYGYTRNKMRLCIQGLPYMIRGKHKQGNNVEVEVYSVDEKTLANLDALEGHPSFYRRDKINIDLDRMDGSNGIVNAYVYMVDDTYDNGLYHVSY